MLALLIAAVLLQATPDTAAKPLEAPHDNGLPKTDYELVAWCHGAVAGQLELDPIVKADMEKIEGKAKVEARAKSDAEMEKERRSYLKDYEHALAAAEAASPSYIHEKGVRAEEHGYGLWTPTRNKEPIWRMLDWGMWDLNDVGCNEAAKRLYEKSKLFGEALKGSDDPAPATGSADKGASVVNQDAKPENDGMIGKLGQRPAAAEGAATTAITSGGGAALAPLPNGDSASTPSAQPAPAPVKTSAKAATKAKKAPAKPKVEPPETALADAQPAKPGDTPAVPPVAETAAAPVQTADQPVADTAPAAVPMKKTAKTTPRKKSPAKPAASDQDVRDAIARGKAELAASPAPAATPPAPLPTDTPAADPPVLRGPQ